MEQLDLFENIDEENKTVEDESPVESDEINESDEIEVSNYTDEQREVLQFAKGIIEESFDPWCPLGIYVSNRKCYKIDFKDKTGNENTNYTIVSSFSAVQKSVKTRKSFKDATDIEIVEIEEKDIPDGAKILQNLDLLLSFKIDLSLSKPKWFSIQYKKSFMRIQVVFNPDSTEITDEEKAILEKCKYSRAGNWCNFDTETTSHEDLMTLLHLIRPILKDRFEFLYDHRLVEPCCCHLQYQCISEKRCVLPNREMQMKCSFRRLKERDGSFTMPAKYKGE